MFYSNLMSSSSFQYTRAGGISHTKQAGFLLMICSMSLQIERKVAALHAQEPIGQSVWFHSSVLMWCEAINELFLANCIHVHVVYMNMCVYEGLLAVVIVENIQYTIDVIHVYKWLTGS